MIEQAEITRVMQTTGKVRGVVFKTDEQYIVSKKGKEGLRQVEEQIEAWGQSLKYGEIKNTEWLPVGLRVVSILGAKEAFSWGEKEIFDMGHSAPQYSFMVKFLMRYFLALEQTYKKSSEYWPAHYTVGGLDAPDFNEKEKYLVLRLRDFEVHPALCPYYAGYFLRIAKLSSSYPNMRVEEHACPYKGGDAHEFVLSWD
ncbi:MAG: hypothetical protein Q8P12_02880 [bacterium]|nr:hypothetical protein [bacterium]